MSSKYDFIKNSNPPIPYNKCLNDKINTNNK